MSLKRIGLTGSVNSQARITGRRITLNRVSLRRFPFPSAAGGGSTALYVEDVFSTYLYTGNGNGKPIVNNIPLTGDLGGSVFFDGSTDSFGISRLSLTGDFTIESWIYFAYTGSNPTTLGELGGGRNNQALRRLNNTHYFLDSTNGPSLQGSITIPTGEWVHLAVTRSGSTTRIFTNGVFETSTTHTGTYTITNIGGVALGVDSLRGYISNLRILDGTALYTATFTPPTTPLTAITNTVFLIGKSPSPSTDYSPSARAITINGSPILDSGNGPFTSSSGSGGMVWIKGRSGAFEHRIYDTNRGPGKYVRSESTAIEATALDELDLFTANGFNVDSGGQVNQSSATYASFTFRKQAKFFDVVTYTGSGTANRQVSHSLGSAPGAIFIKKISGAVAPWACWHRNLDSGTYLRLNEGAAALVDSRYFPGSQTSTYFTIDSNGTADDVNRSGESYVAYLFAHDAGGFGALGTDNVISCGSFTTDGSGNAPAVNLGYEPQWILLKSATNAQSWIIYDTMRSWSVTSSTYLLPNSTTSEVVQGAQLPITATGFGPSVGGLWLTNTTYIYIAIRRGPMKTPTSGTSVFSPVARTGTSAAATMTAGFAPDAVFLSNRDRSYTNYNPFYDKLRGYNAILSSNNTGAEQSLSGSITQYTNTGITLGSDAFGNINGSGAAYINWIFQRAPGFFDVVCYTGTGANRTVTHNLGVAPEFMIVKSRTTASDWVVWHSALPILRRIRLNTTAATDANDTQHFGGTLPTSSVFSVGSTNSDVSTDYVAYLFATVAGVSKVGSYTGTGTTQQINCGFTTGARFVLIKRTDSTGDWYLWDTARGITVGNDPYLLLNSTVAEVTNTSYVDPYNPGFQVNSTAPAAINANGGTYIFLAIA